MSDHHTNGIRKNYYLGLEFMSKFNLRPLLIFLIFPGASLPIRHLHVFSFIVLPSPFLCVLVELDSTVRSTSESVNGCYAFTVRTSRDVCASTFHIRFGL